MKDLFFLSRTYGNAGKGGKIEVDYTFTYPNLSVPTHKQDGPITKNSSSASATSARRTSNVKESRTHKPEAVLSKSRSDIWKRTGVVALHDCDLKVSYSDLFG
jgi:hypothetical protein